MKKYYIFVLLIGILSGFSQPVLNQSDLSNFYNSDSYSAFDVSGLSTGNAGANQTWDFSGITTLELDGTFSFVPYNTSPYASSFPTANFVLKSSSLGDPDSYYSYYKSSPTLMESVGDADSMGIYLDIDSSTLFQFPYVYNTVINDTYQYYGDPTIYSFTSTYDAYGTLITPFATFSNVIRQKKVEIDGTDTYTDYSWFTTNPFRYIMGIAIISSGTDSFNFVTVMNNFTPLNLKEFRKNSIVSVYPNPTTAELRIQFPDNVNIDKIVVIDISGKIVIQQTENINRINVDKLPSGVYILESYSANDKFQNKFIKE